MKIIASTTVFQKILGYRFSPLLAASLLVIGAAAVRAQTAAAPQAKPPASISASAAGTVAITTSMEALNDTVKLGNGDRVSFRVVEDRREPITLVVTDTGEMEIPFIGRVIAANKTCRQLAREIKPLLEKDYFYQATVIIGLDVIGARPRGQVYVTGEVKSQGPIDLPSDHPLTVSRAILRAGGLGDFADKKKVKLIRKKGGQETVTIIDVADILVKGHLLKDPPLEPDDVVIVPERLINF